MLLPSHPLRLGRTRLLGWVRSCIIFGSPGVTCLQSEDVFVEAFLSVFYPISVPLSAVCLRLHGSLLTSNSAPVL